MVHRTLPTTTLCHKWDCVNEVPCRVLAYISYQVISIDSGQILNIYLLSKVTCLHLQFCISNCNLYFCHERFWKNIIDCEVLEDVGFFQRCLNWHLMPLISRGVKAFTNYPLIPSLCSRCCRRDSLCFCYGGRWWRRVFFKEWQLTPLLSLCLFYHLPWFRYAISMDRF